MELATGIVILVFNLLMLKEAGNTGVAAYGVIANISYVVIAIYTGSLQGVQPREQSFGEGDMALCAKEFALCCLDYCRGFCFSLWSHFFLFRRDHTDIQQ